jgi:uncharacterized protein YrrD
MFLYRSMDFFLMEVRNMQGKKIGIIKDLLINLSKSEVEGFLVTSYRFFTKNFAVYSEDVICFKDKMIVKETGKGYSLKLADIKNMEIVDLRGGTVGLLEDIIFEERNFKILGVVASDSFINNITCGKRILTVKELIFGELDIMFSGEGSKIEFSTLPHRFLTKGTAYEKAS